MKYAYARVSTDDQNPALQLAALKRAGIQAAKGRGVKFGHKPKLTPQQISHAHKQIKDGQRREDPICSKSLVPRFIGR
ncbi:MAG: hypothetical protein ACRD3O_01195 [Terriglobia bacterium]